MVVFDLLHTGHIVGLAQIRDHASKTYAVNQYEINLIVGVITQNRLQELKPKDNYLTTEDSRKEELMSTGLVNEVIFQNGVEDVPRIPMEF